MEIPYSGKFWRGIALENLEICYKFAHPNAIQLAICQSYTTHNIWQWHSSFVGILNLWDIASYTLYQDTQYCVAWPRKSAPTPWVLHYLHEKQKQRFQVCITPQFLLKSTCIVFHYSSPKPRAHHTANFIEFIPVVHEIWLT